jgi:hypothetical protein
MIDELIERFSSQAPATVMFRSLFARLFSQEVLDGLFSKHCRQQHESPVLFSYLVHLVTPVVSGSRTSINASYVANRCPQSSQAVYDKLKGVEPSVSAALVCETVQELRAIQDKAKVRRKDLIKGYHTYVIDGKTYNSTEHRITESRFDARAPLPGRAVAVLDTRYLLFVDIECSTNAHRCERKILEPILDRLQAGALYIADRNFSDGIILGKFYQSKAFFIIRQHGACPKWRETDKPRREFERPDGKGGKVSEKQIEVCMPNGSWQVMRRVCVRLKQPTRDGDKTIYLLTNLPSSVTARQIADAYSERWTIETCLGHLAQSLNAEIKTLCYPKAAGFCFCVALMLYNMMSTIRSLLEAHAEVDEKDKEKRHEVSLYYMATEIVENQGGMEIAIDATHWTSYHKLSLANYCKFLISVAKQAKLKRYRKTGRGPIKLRPKRRFTGSRHVATQKFLDARKMLA